MKTILGCAVLCGIALAQDTVNVTGIVSIVRTGRGEARPPDYSGAVVWLKPAEGRAVSSAPRAHFQIKQQNKRFDPHLLAVPVDSKVDFPNLDPFFHNVFSMFDGKRFDLGLYEAGASRTVTFDRPGICYIFCNIHPDMSAVIVVVDSPYFSVSARSGEFTLANVPPGRYLLSVWHERGKPEAAGEFPREVTVAPQMAPLGAIHLLDSGQLVAPHKNKYGRDYDHSAPGPIYK